MKPALNITEEGREGQTRLVWYEDSSSRAEVCRWMRTEVAGGAVRDFELSGSLGLCAKQRKE
jgi:hypothetical protein